MNDPMYYDVIICNNNGIQCMIKNEYVDANRYLQTALQHLKALVGSNQQKDQHHQQQRQKIDNTNHQSENNINTCTTCTTNTMKTTVTATVTAAPSQQPPSTLSLSCTDFIIRDTIEYDSISLINMRITSSNTNTTVNVSSATTYNNMTLWNEEMNVLKFLPIQIEMIMASKDIIVQQTSNNNRINRLDMLICIILYNIAICCFYHDINNKKSLSSSLPLSHSNGDNIVHQHGNLTHCDKCYMSYRLLTAANTVLCEILSVSFGSIIEQDEDSIVPLWFGLHQLEYRILSVLIYLIRCNDDSDIHHHNHHHFMMASLSSTVYEQMIQRFHNVQKIIMLHPDIIQTFFDRKNINVAPCA